MGARADSATSSAHAFAEVRQPRCAMGDIAHGAFLSHPGGAPPASTAAPCVRHIRSTKAHIDRVHSAPVRTVFKRPRHPTSRRAGNNIMRKAIFFEK